MATRGIENLKFGDAAAHESFLRYRGFRWFKIGAILSLILIVVYLLVDVQPRHNGGSWLGYTLGTVGAALIVWLALARHPQAGDDARALVAEGLDLGARLSRADADHHRHAPHRLPVRLERPHPGLCR